MRRTLIGLALSALLLGLGLPAEGVHGGPGGDEEELRETQASARVLRVQIQSLQVQDPSQFQSAYVAAMTRERAEALIIFHGIFTFLKAAKQIGLTIPSSVLARADRVIK